MNRLVLAFGVLVAAAAVAAALLATVASGGRSSAGVTFHLVEKDQAFHYIDNPPTSRQHVASQGDMLVFKSALLSTSMQPSGMLVASCTVTSGGLHTMTTCYRTFLLKGGQLIGAATVRETRVSHIAILGGTGIYEGARGMITSVSRGDNSPFADDTVHLLP